MIIDNFTYPEDGRGGGVCGVTAIAASTGITFARAFSLCASYSLKRRFTGGTTLEQRLQVLSHLGVDYKAIQMPRMTLKKFASWYAKPNTTYMVTTTRHVQLIRVIDGEPYALDQAGCKPIEKYWGRNKYINRDILIMPELANEPEPTKERPFMDVLPSALVEVQPSLFPSLQSPEVLADNRHQLNLF
jgi:hypothetical protein